MLPEGFVRCSPNSVDLTTGRLLDLAYHVSPLGEGGGLEYVLHLEGMYARGCRQTMGSYEREGDRSTGIIPVDTLISSLLHGEREIYVILKHLFGQLCHSGSKKQIYCTGVDLFLLKPVWGSASHAFFSFLTSFPTSCSLDLRTHV